MGKEYDRIKSYENRYYARAEGRARAKRKRETNKTSEMVMIVIMFIGVVIAIFSPNIWGKVLGIVIALLGLGLIIWSVRYYKNH